MKKTLILFTAGILFWCSGCEEVIDWEVKEGQVRLVVEGSVTNELKNHTVSLSHTVNYFDSPSDMMVSNATVSVTDGEQVFLYEELENTGIYQSLAPYHAEVGKTYTLRITLDQEIGEHYTFEASTTMHRLIPFDSITVDYEKEPGLEEMLYVLNIYGTEPVETDDNYKALVYRNGNLITQQVDDVIYFNDELFQGQKLEKFALYSSDEIMEGDEVTLELYAIEKTYYDFLNQMSSAKDGGDPFGISGPLSNVYGNISNNALGYFYVADKVQLKAIARENHQ